MTRARGDKSTDRSVGCTMWSRVTLPEPWPLEAGGAESKAVWGAARAITWGIAVVVDVWHHNHNYLPLLPAYSSCRHLTKQPEMDSSLLLSCCQLSRRLEGDQQVCRVLDGSVVLSINPVNSIGIALTDYLLQAFRSFGAN